MGGGKGGDGPDTSGMEAIYQQALDHAIQQDNWNRDFLQTQWEWGAQDRERLLANNNLDREMYYSMLGQDRAYNQDAYNYNKAMGLDAYEYNKAMGQDSYNYNKAMGQDAYDYNKAMSSQAFAYNQGINAQNAANNEADRAMFSQALAAHQASVDRANQMAQAEWNWNRANVESDRAYYDANYKPVEQALIADSVATPVKYDAATAQASADVAGAFDNQMGIQRREMARYGVDPMSGRYASANRALGLGRAAAQVGAMNQARAGVKASADANRAAALQVGQTHRNTQLVNPNHYNAYTMAQFKSSQLNPLNYQQVTAPQLQAQQLGAPSANYNGMLSTPNSWGGMGLPGQFSGAAAGVAQNFGNAMQGAANAQAQADAQNGAGLAGGIGAIAGGLMAYY